MNAELETNVATKNNCQGGRSKSTPNSPVPHDTCPRATCREEEHMAHNTPHRRHNGGDASSHFSVGGIRHSLDHGEERRTHRLMDAPPQQARRSVSIPQTSVKAGISDKTPIWLIDHPITKTESEALTVREKKKEHALEKMEPRDSTPIWLKKQSSAIHLPQLTNPNAATQLSKKVVAIVAPPKEKEEDNKKPSWLTNEKPLATRRNYIFTPRVNKIKMSRTRVHGFDFIQEEAALR
ncbi:hypothetical protein PROFUN_07231 [Planoprotostelium fungivorum]|uniref:Uncharacterized protein n=1 Tax=Planoprotostelium fungivorum TaxID=1890364 RepID=A0A2P6NM54_9EUKA|nr:hypothetical protein PROFUN_07231 [Planoprotostelium fungivorum]